MGMVDSSFDYPVLVCSAAPLALGVQRVAGVSTDSLHGRCFPPIHTGKFQLANRVFSAYNQV